jgi:preprotein translocase subunit SecB
MNETTKAAFNIVNYQITDFSFHTPEVDSDGIQVSFDPKGEYSRSNNTYKLTINFRAYTDSEQREQVISTSLIAWFQFAPIETALPEIPDFFYRNSIAIVYPYLRSFVSVLTIQAQVKHLLLPVLNLSSLENKLRDNTVIS